MLDLGPTGVQDDKLLASTRKQEPSICVIVSSARGGALRTVSDCSISVLTTAWSSPSNWASYVRACGQCGVEHQPRSKLTSPMASADQQISTKQGSDILLRGHRLPLRRRRVHVSGWRSGAIPERQRAGDPCEHAAYAWERASNEPRRPRPRRASCDLHAITVRVNCCRGSS